MNREDKLWYLLALFIVGIALHEYGAKVVTHLETVQNDYSSLNHTFYLSVLTVGLMVSMYSGLTIYFDVKQGLNTVTAQEKKR